MIPSNSPELETAADDVALSIASYRKKTNQLVIVLWILSILIAGFHTWIGRHSMNPDGVTYLDIADAYRHGHWKAALNSYRSPFYSWMLIPALAITQASPATEFAAVHIVNFIIFLIALFCFHYLLTAVIRIHPNLALSNWAMAGAAYALFLWTTLEVITLELVTPDVCVAAVVYAATGVLLRVRKGHDQWAIFLALGLILGVGYLVKAALLVLAPLLAILCAAAIGTVRQAIPKVMLVAIGFLMIAAPWVYALSTAKGRFTLGDAGTLAYGYMVQEVPMLHWHGGPAGSGVPVHPDRQIYHHPDTFEFATPISGTYPPSYDYSYWAQGMTVRPHIRTHLRRLAKSLREYFTFFDQRLTGIISVVVLLWLIGDRRRDVWRRLAQEWKLLVPALYGFVLYAQVWIDWRYLGAYLTLFWIGILCAVRIPEFAWKDKVTGAAGVAIMVVLGFHLLDFSYTSLRQRDPMLEHLKVVTTLQALQVGPGSAVASIGDANLAFWARLARVKIVAEIPFDIWDPVLLSPEVSDVDIFWAASREEKANVMRKLAETGAKVVVTQNAPPGADGAGWQRIVGTSYSVYRF